MNLSAGTILLALCLTTVLLVEDSNALPWNKKTNEINNSLSVESQPPAPSGYKFSQNAAESLLPDGYDENEIVKRQTVNQDDLVRCYNTLSFCRGFRISTPNGLTDEQCCVERDGLAFMREGGEGGCRKCVVFGWYQRTFIASESSDTYTLLAGYQKGGDEHGEDLSFRIVPVYSGTATADDITLITQSVTLRWDNSPPSTIEFKLNRDRDDKEGDETFTLRLFYPFIPQFGSNYFTFYDIAITIEDRQPLCSNNCDGAACDNCLPRFTGLGCCDCAEGYYLNTDTDLCELPCEETTVDCQNGLCTCVANYRLPDCCQCDEFSFSPQPDAVDLRCEGACRVGVEKCSGGVCTCKTGYTGIDCCRCESDHFRDGDECKPACANNIDECSNGRCICQEGYSGSGCCDCASKYYRSSTTDRCIPSCFEGTQSCGVDSCLCRDGYEGTDCCQCRSDHFRDVCSDICTLIDQEEGQDDLVDCFTENQCGGTRRRMSRELCCVQSRGVSYSAEGDEFGCRTCVVFGWKYDCVPFIQPERAQPYELGIGYLKGNEELDENIQFQIQPVLQTASLEDFSLSQTTVEVLASDTELKLVGLTLVEDGVALEPNEVFTLDLVINGGQERSGDNTFFLRNKTITIKDIDVKCAVGVESCGMELEFCACRAGYKDPDCCDCEDGYYRDPDTNQCLPPCPEGTSRCTTGICLCNDGYTGIDCCDCDVGYYRDSSTQTCQEYCDPGVLAGCSTSNCQCDTGYTGPGCCECATGYERNGDICIEQRCSFGVVSCSSTRCICKEGYSGPKCCDCASGYYRDQSNTSICVPPCFEGTVGCTDDGGCTCRPGYVGADCCNCDSTYYRSRCSGDLCVQIELQDGDNAVDCFTEGNCRGTRRRMTPELCCVESNGVSYQSEGAESCTVCVVYGWNDTCTAFRAPERAQSYSFKLGYIKGGDEYRENFRWRLESRLIDTATKDDFTINTPTVNIPFDSPNFEEASVTFVVDGIAQEGDESFDINLVFDNIPEPVGNGLFFSRRKRFTIVDTETTCEVGTDSCDNNECTCKPEYLPPSCCDCIDGYIKNDDGVCEVRCSDGQDIYFLVDVTSSNRVGSFCNEIYAIQLISAALRPRVGNDLDGTRIGTFLYPKDFGLSNVTYFQVGRYGCKETVNSFHRLMEAFVASEDDIMNNDTLLNLQRESLRGSSTLPVPAINFLANVIEGDVVKYGAERRRIVVILTDGVPDGAGDREVRTSINNLLEKGGKSLTLIAGGVATAFMSPTELTDFENHVKLLANDIAENSYVTSTDSTSNAGVELGIALVNIMDRNDAICEERANDIRMELSDSNNLYYCTCNLLRFRGDYCKESCPSDVYNSGRDNCLAPPTDACSATVEEDDTPAKLAASDNDSKLNRLQEQIIAAVENVLVEEGLIELEDD